MTSHIRDLTVRSGVRWRVRRRVRWPVRWRVVVPRGRRVRDEFGVVSPVAVLIFPALLLGIMLIVQFSLYLHAGSVAEAAAQDAAAAARQTDGSEGAARVAAQEALGTLGPRMLTGTSVAVERSATSARAVVTAQVVSLVPGLTLRVRESAQGPVERYVPAPAAVGGAG